MLGSADDSINGRVVVVDGKDDWLLGTTLGNNNGNVAVVGNTLGFANDDDVDNKALDVNDATSLATVDREVGSGIGSNDDDSVVG